MTHWHVCRKQNCYIHCILSRDRTNLLFTYNGRREKLFHQKIHHCTAVLSSCAGMASPSRIYNTTMADIDALVTVLSRRGCSVVASLLLVHFLHVDSWYESVRYLTSMRFILGYCEWRAVASHLGQLLDVVWAGESQKKNKRINMMRRRLLICNFWVEV